jgi:aminopeptidase N
MLKKALLLFLIPFIFEFSNAQGLPHSLRIDGSERSECRYVHYSKMSSEKNSNNAVLASQIQRRAYDVLSYDIYFDWYHMLSSDSVKGEARYWWGRNAIECRLDSATETIELDAIGLQIDSIIINGSMAEYLVKSATIIVSLPNDIKQGDVFTATVYYKYINEENIGFFLYPKEETKKINDSKSSVYYKERLAYLTSEPENARYWLPSNDRPYDKAAATITVRVPIGFFPASNGLIDTIIKTDTSETYVWKDTTPITTYLISVAASKYYVYTEYYKKISNPLDSIPVMYVVWEKDYYNTDTAENSYNPKIAFKNTVDYMALYSEVFGEYPFCKYGMVAVEPFFGGMENQTMTMIARQWLDGKQSIGIAHELAHQWLGDLVTCATWRDVWINEGGATWAEYLMWEKYHGDYSYEDYFTWELSYYLNSGGLELGAIYDVPINDIFSSGAVLTYTKAGMVYSMLRKYLGIETMYSTMKGLLQRYAFQSIETDDFRDYFKENVPNPPVDFDIFFEQWIRKAGHPQYKVKMTTNDIGDGNYHVILNISQVQTGTNVPEVFVAPERIMLLDNTQTQYLIDTILCNAREQIFEFDLPFMPAKIYFDNTYTIHEISSTIVTVCEEDRRFNGIEATIGENPLRKGGDTRVSIFLPNDGDINVELTDIFGNVPDVIYSGYLSSGSYSFHVPAENLASGVYFLRIHCGKEMKVVKFVVSD